MTTRETVHGLIDRLPEELLSEAEGLLRQLTPGEEAAAIRAFLDTLPEEDEDLSPRELEAVRRHNAGVRTGKLYTHAEVLDAINSSARE